MAEELLEFENTIEDPDGNSYVALVLAEEREDGRWLGRIRFTPADGSQPIETDRETTQPDRDDLAYWARGLTYFYLQGALERARRAAGSAPAAAPRAAERAGPSPHHVPRLEVASPDPGVVAEVMGDPEPRPGTARAVAEAGIVVYEGVGGTDGASHLFAVQFSSRNAGAILGNWLWSRLHGKAAEVRVDGRPVGLTNEALNRELLGE